MALVIKDRVKVRTRSIGTGSVTLENTVDGFRSFAVIGDGNETFYGIVDSIGRWEIGRGTYSAIGPTLSRDTVLSSSNNDLAVDFETGSKTVFCTFPASLAQTNFSNAGSGFGNFTLNGHTIDTTDGGAITIQRATTVNGNLTVTGNITASGSYAGNAASATKLQTARTINGVSFDGTTNITVTADANTLTGTTLKPAVVNSSLTHVGTITSGTWSANFGNVSGANLTNLTANNLVGTIPPGVLGNSQLYVGTTPIALNRTPVAQSLTGVSIDGNSYSATKLQTARNINGVSFDGMIDITVPAAANTLTTNTLASNVVNSSLTSVGTLTSLRVDNVVHRTVAWSERKHSNVQLVSNATPGRIEFDTELTAVSAVGLTYDAPTDVHPGRFTNTSGETRSYSISTSIVFDINNAGYRVAWIEKVGVVKVRATTVPIAGDYPQITLSTTVSLSPTEYFEVYAYQTSGVNLGTGVDPFGGNYISITWI